MKNFEMIFDAPDCITINTQDHVIKMTTAQDGFVAVKYDKDLHCLGMFDVTIDERNNVLIDIKCKNILGQTNLDWQKEGSHKILDNDYIDDLFRRWALYNS